MYRHCKLLLLCIHSYQPAREFPFIFAFRPQLFFNSVDRRVLKMYKQKVHVQSHAKHIKYARIHVLIV